MKQVYRALTLIAWNFSFCIPLWAHEPKNVKDVSTCLAFENIYNIDFKDQDYEIDFWCSVTYPQDKPFNFRDQLQVVDAKKTEITLVDSSMSHHLIKLLLKFNCKIFHKWDVIGFPFDGQDLAITLYNAAFDTKQFRFVSDEHGLHHKNNIVLENGWGQHKHREPCVKIDSLLLPFNDTTYYSSITIVFDIDRANKWGLFSKLFVGMYVAFFVAFLALFISLRNHSEPHFGLTVGALFAAIANKYIVEGSLPESPFFNLADKLHALTFTAITFIILLSVVALFRLDKLKINKRGFLSWIIKYAWLIILIPYLILSIGFIRYAYLHHQ